MAGKSRALDGALRERAEGADAAAVVGSQKLPRQLDYRKEDPDFWMCPLPEGDRAPLLHSTRK
jgi:hypothetical protein